MISSVEFLTSQTALRRSNSQVFTYISQNLEHMLRSRFFFKHKKITVFENWENNRSHFQLFFSSQNGDCFVNKNGILTESKHSRISHIFFKRDDDENKCIEAAGILLSTFNKQHLQLCV